MKRAAILIGLAATVGAFAGDSSASGPLRVSARAEAGPHYVGQAIEIRVEVEGADVPPSVEPPKVADADLRAVDAPDGAAARFLVVGQRAGILEVPPFRARSGDRSGASRTTRLTVANVPPDGRTSAYSGGVGPFELRAEARPTSLRPGQTIDFLIRMTGPAAWGSVRSPDLSDWSSSAVAARVEPSSSVLEGGDPPVRTFRYRLRPTRSGRTVLPPVAVSAFDPKARRYSTRYTAGIPIRVEEPPRFDPARLDYGPAPGTSGMAPRPGRWLVVLGLILAAGSAFAGSRYLARRREAARLSDPRRLALELGRGLDAGGDGVDAARRVADALATFLHRVGGRPPGTLTPIEARDAVDRLTLDRDLAGRAGSLIELCDRARYGGRGADGDRLIAAGRGLLESVAREVATRRRDRGGPREAVETA